MESNEKKFTEQESLAVIVNMIQAAKTGLKDNSFYFFLWGWLVFIASITQYTLIWLGNEYSGLVWMLMPVGGIVTCIYSHRRNKTTRVKTYIDEFMKYVLTAFLVSLFIVLFFMFKLGLSTYPLIMLVYGIWLYISGGTIKFKPLMAGGIINWCFAIGALYVDFKLQLLFLASAVLLGYIIPGYLLKENTSKMFHDLDPLLHSQLRLSIMSLLISVKEAEFSYLKEKTNASAGNLSVQINKLADADYITVKKSFRENYPLTTCKITATGIKAFETYVNNIQQYLNHKK